MKFGGFWVRVVAYIIDTLVLLIPSGIVSAILGTGWGFAVYARGANPEGLIPLQLASIAINVAMQWIYYAGLESSSMQATLGKKAMGLIVTDEGGSRIGFGRATGRYFAKILSSFILCIGFMMVGWTERKQGLHDKLAGTLVLSGSPGYSFDAAVFE